MSYSESEELEIARMERLWTKGALSQAEKEELKRLELKHPAVVAGRQIRENIGKERQRQADWKKEMDGVRLQRKLASLRKPRLK